MNKFIVERTDGTTDHIEADILRCTGGIVTFYEIIGPYEQTKIVRAYPYHSVVCVMPYEEGKENSNEEPERRKNDNNDLISRSGLIEYLKTHWSSNIIEVISNFEKAEFLD